MLSKLVSKVLHRSKETSSVNVDYPEVAARSFFVEYFESKPMSRLDLQQPVSKLQYYESEPIVELKVSRRRRKIQN